MSRRTAISCLGLLLLQAAAALDTAFTHSPCVDEGQHLLSGILAIRRGDPGYYFVNPPLIKTLAALPIAWSCELPPGPRGETIFEQVGYYERFVEANRDRLPSLIRWSRCVQVALLFACGVQVAWLASRLYGNAGALVATAAWALHPLAVAWSAVVTTDLGAALFCLALVNVSYKYLERPTPGRRLAVALVLAGAMLSKFTLLALIPFALWAVAVGCRRAGHSSFGAVVQVALVAGLALVCVNVGYSLSGCGRPVGDFHFRSNALTARHGKGTVFLRVNRFAGGPLHELPSPFPADFVLGIDEQTSDSDAGLPALVGDTWSREGRAYYYPLALVLKTPTGTLVLVSLALGLAVRSRHANLFVWLPPAVLMALLVAHPGMQGHPRYLLPAVPFLAVACGALVAAGRWAVGVVVVCIALNVVEFASSHPNHLASLNSVSGGVRAAPNRLGDYATDFGQDLFLLRDWLREHPEARPFSHHTLVGLDATVCGLPPRTRAEIRPLPGRQYLAVSSATLNGFDAVPDMKSAWVTRDPRNPFAPLLYVRPCARIGSTIFVYELCDGVPVDPGTGAEVRHERGHVPLVQLISSQ